MSHSTRRTFLHMLTIGALIGTCTLGFAVEQTNFTGHYSGQQSTGADHQAFTSIHVTQDANSIEIVRDERGKTATNHFFLDGREGDYGSPGGISGKGKAEFKGKDLLVESIAVSRPQRDGSVVRLRTKERWHLSPDGKRLTIRFNVNFPDLEQLTHGVTDQSWTETYTRTDTR